MEVPSSPKNTAITRNLQRVLSIKLEDEDLQTALRYVGEFYKENTLKNRRNLRSCLEQKSLETHKKFLQEFSIVNQQLQTVKDIVKELRNTCDEMFSALNESKSKTHKFLTTMNSLNNDLENTEKHAQLIEEFIAQFQLTDQEKEILTSGKVDHMFFATLKKVHDIHSKCTYMFKNQQHKCGLEIMEEMSVYQDTAYERLSRWIQNECKLLSNDDVKEFKDIQYALNALVERPVLLKCCLKEIISARQASIVRRFFEALTKGGSGTKRVKPIEMQAHDPLRYIGDILAWTHQAAAYEREIIGSLLSIEDSPTSFDEINETTDTRVKVAFDVLNQIFESLRGHLKLRVEQILNSESDAVIYFRLAHVLELYSTTIAKLVGTESTLPKFLLELKDMAMDKFFKFIEVESGKLKTELPQIPIDLSPPDVMSDTLLKLTDIMNTYSKSVVAEDRREEDFGKVLSAMLDPLTETVKKVAEQNLNKDDSVDSLVFLINCYFTIQKTLSQFKFTSKKVEDIANEMDKFVEMYIKKQSDSLLKKCGLADKVAKIKAHSNQTLSELEGLSTEEMTECIQNFYSSLFALGSQLVIPQQQNDRINSTKLRQYTRNRVATELVQAYTLIYDAIQNPKNGYKNPNEIVFHIPKKIKILLDID